MAWIGGLIAAAGAIGGGLLGSSASKSAANQQAGSAQNALNFERQVYGTTQSNLQPFIGTGQNALSALSQLYGLNSGGAGGNALDAYRTYSKTPFYTFPYQQGLQALQQSGAARGLTLSGGQANALQQYGQGYASTNFGNYINALAGLANLGATSSANLGSFGNTNANLQAGSNAFQGNALAQGTVNSASSITNALSQLPAILAGNNGSSYGGGNALAGLGQGISNALYNPVTSLGVYGNTGGAGTNALQSMGFYNPLSGS